MTVVIALTHANVARRLLLPSSTICLNVLEHHLHLSPSEKPSSTCGATNPLFISLVVLIAQPAIQRIALGALSCLVAIVNSRRPAKTPAVLLACRSELPVPLVFLTHLSWQTAKELAIYLWRHTGTMFSDLKHGQERALSQLHGDVFQNQHRHALVASLGRADSNTLISLYQTAWVPAAEKFSGGQRLQKTCRK